MKKVLIITYYWPPSGGAGVQRWLKFSKYLPLYGWEPVILTVDPDYATYPAFDTTLEKEIPDTTRVFRTKATDWFRFYSKDKTKVPSAGFATNADNSVKGKISRFIRGNFFIPDPRRGWNRFAIRKACELINNENIRHIITTSPPHSTQLIGLELKKRFPGLNWICDLRDTWTDIYYYDLFYPTALARRIDRNFEKEVLKNADRIITVGDNLALSFANTAGVKNKISVLPNGYDENDFEGIAPVHNERFTISYIGTISASYPIDGFLEALNQLIKAGKDFILRFAGAVPQDARDRIISILGETRTDFTGYVEHREAIRVLASSDLLLLVIPDTKQNKIITPGKVFEYLATGKPVLYIGPPDGDAASHLVRCGQQGIFGSEETGKMVQFISGIMEGTPATTEKKYLVYSRKKLTGDLAGILNSSSDGS